MRKGSTTQPWLARMLNRKPPMLVIVALANKMARIAGIDGERRNLSGSGDGEVGPPPVLKV